MTIELRILTGPRAGTWTRFEKPVVTIGRHPSSDLHFDPDVDLDVSARHAELRLSDLGGWTLHDLRSTNGTYVNGDRVAEHRRVFSGDVITFGRGGPKAEVRVAERTARDAVGWRGGGGDAATHARAHRRSRRA